MVARFLQDHFLGAVLVLVLISIVIGVLGIYVMGFILALNSIITAVFSYFGVSYG